MKKNHSVCFLFLGLMTLWGVSYAAAGTVTYTYDSAGRLTRAGYGGGSITYTYDANGNLLQRKTVSAAGDLVLDIKANGEDGPVRVTTETPVSVTVSLDPGSQAGQNADWWIAAHTPFDPPGDWYSYVHPDGWRTGVHPCLQTPLFELAPTQVLNMTLPIGSYTFYFAVDNPDGMPESPWIGLDSVDVQVE
jgi:hypothetical protein